MDTEVVKIPFTIGSRLLEPQAVQQYTESIEFFKLFFTNGLISEIVQEMNKYACTKLTEKNLSTDSMCNTWVDVTVNVRTFRSGIEYGYDLPSKYERILVKT